MKKISLLSALIVPTIAATNLSAQTTDADVTKGLFKLSFFTPALGYEFRVAPKFTIQPELSIDFTDLQVKYYDNNGEQKKSNTYYGANIQVQGRFYYNLDKRLRKGKSIANNSGYYLALSVGQFSPFAHSNDYFTVQNHEFPYPDNTYVSNVNFGIYWGLQRVYKSHLFIDLRLGFQSAYFYNTKSDVNYQSNNFTAFAPHFAFRFGYVFSH